MIQTARLLRTFLGLGVGVVVTTAIAGPFSSFVRASPDPELDNTYRSILIMGSLIVDMLAGPIGLAGHAILYARKWRGLLPYTLFGALGGAAFVVLSHDVQFLFVRGRLLQELLLYTLWTTGIAVMAWLIRRPDRDGNLPKPETHF